MANTEVKPRKNRPEAKPFYLASGTTSAEIIAEARTSVRCVDTKRPCTPVESQRTLFGASRRPESHSRPPSAFSIGPRHFADPDLPSPTTPLHRLQPLGNAPDVPDGPALNNPDIADHVVIQADRKVMQGVRLSKSVDPLQPFEISSSDNSVLLPSPPRPVRPPNHLNVSRRSSTGNIAKQKLAENHSDTRRAHSGPAKRSSTDNVSETRAKSSPTMQRHMNETSADCANSTENDSEVKKLSRLYKEHVRPVLKEMDSNLQQEDAKSMCENCQRLLATLRKVGILPETMAVEMSSFKAQILKCLFSYLGVKDPLLHLRLAKIVLMFNLSVNNEENIFKLMFKVSRDENNDRIFMEEEVTDLLIKKVSKFDGNAKYEAWIYSVGALKLLSGNSVVRKTIVNSGCIEALGIVVRNIIKQNNTDQKVNKKNTNLLIPVTAVLRNLADVTGSRDLFLKKNILGELVLILKLFKNDRDVAMNICRILSKMTLYDECCNAVSSVASCFETFLRVLGIHLKSQEIVVRVLFILGNLTTKSDDTRHNLYFTKGSTKYLLLVFQAYFERNIEASKTGEEKEDNTEQENTEDVLNKMVRVVANLSIHPEVGPEITKNVEVVELLIQILETKELTTNEELVLNTVATINNLSYYTEENTALGSKRDTITQLLMGLLVADNMDAILEASRVFGNFSRFKDVRNILSSHKVDEMMISLLDSGSHEIVYTACGVLINMMVDCDKRSILKDEGGIKKLIDVLRDFGKIDWQLAAMVCQTLWNYGDNMCSVYETFGEEETTVLTDLLREYLDEETAFDYVSSRKIDPSVQKLLRETWKENFEMVGEHLLQRIESKQSDLVPLEDPT